MPKLATRLVAASATAIASAGVIAACSSNGSGNSSAADKPAASQPAMPSTDMGSMPASDMPAPTTGNTVNATETEFHIALSSSKLKAGTYTFAVKNAGQITHALTVDGPGVDNKSSGSINGGQSAKMTVTLKAGKYDVYCPVGSHKMEGMDTSITVS